MARKRVRLHIIENALLKGQTVTESSARRIGLKNLSAGISKLRQNYGYSITHVNERAGNNRQISGYRLSAFV